MTHPGLNRLACLLLLFAALPSSEIRYFRYQRPIQNTPQQSGQTCLVVDAPLFARSAPGLADLRVYRDRSETPYLLETSAPGVSSGQSIPVLNLGVQNGQTVFDAAMAAEKYSDIQLRITGQNFIATVAVTGSQKQEGKSTLIGSYTIFDLTRQRLGRSTVFHLPVSDFRYLHFRIAGPIRPEDVSGLFVSQSSTIKPRYLTVSESSRVILKDRSSVVEFTVPGHVPIDRIEIVPADAPANFSRAVHVEATPVAAKPATEYAEPPRSSSSYGSVLRIHTVQNAHRIDEESLSVDPPRTSYDTSSKWTVTVDNGDDAPLKPAFVRLLMLERNLCFDAAPGSSYALYYGDSALAPPRYDYASLFTRQPDAPRATLGPEQPNSEYQPRPNNRPFTEKHPVLLWLALALVVVVLGVVALRTAKSSQHPT